MHQFAIISVLNEENKSIGIPVDDILRVLPRAGGSIILYRSGGQLISEDSQAVVIAAIKTKWDEYRTRGAVQELVTKTAAYTATVADFTILCDATSAAFTVTLPPAADVQGRILVVKKIDSSGNAITIDGNASETIDGAATKSLASQWTTMMIQSSGSNWYIMAAGATA